MSRKSKFAQKLNDYQPLEQRRLLVGDVTVFEDVNLYIRGNGDNNQFEIVASGDELQIVGLRGTTINQQDSYTVEGATITDSGVSFAGGLRAHLGPGHDELSLRDVQFESLSIVFGGTGNDSIDVFDSGFLDDVVIQTYDGNDSVAAYRSEFGDGFRATTLDGQDSVTLVETAIHGNAIVSTGNHTDSIHATDSHFLGEVNLLLAHNGDDSVQVNNPVVGESQLGIFLGNGDDVIHGDFSDAKVEGTVRVGGQRGVDRGEMTMDAEMASKVSMASMEGTGELVYDGLDGVVDFGRDSYTIQDTQRINFASAQQIQFEEDTDIYSIAFTGSYENSWANEYSNYVIKVYGNESGESQYVGKYEKPSDEVVYEVELSLDELNRVATGETYREGDSFFDPEREIYEFSGDVEMQFAAGEKYWVTIYQRPQLNPADPTNYDEFDNLFYWHGGLSETENLTTTFSPEAGWNEVPLEGAPYEIGMSFELRS
jgi:hypothetical protein